MKIGMMLPATTALHSPGDGVRVQAWRQAEALERLGHTVVRLNPWEAVEDHSLDVVHLFMGGHLYAEIELAPPSRAPLLAFAPIIDSNRPNWSYRLTAAMGMDSPRSTTSPWLYRQLALRSRAIIARSLHERLRAIRGLGADERRVHVVLNGADPPNGADPDGARRRLGLPEAFVLHVSTYTQPRKNVVAMLRALAPTGFPIVLAGTARPGVVLDRIRAFAQQHPQIRVLDFVDRETLQGLYAACRVFCLPSRHEGTGLAALEAAALGARVVITKHGGPPDYFLDLAEYVDPASGEDIGAAVVRAWNAAPSDALRRHVTTALTWDRSAAALVEAYARGMEAP